MLLLETFSRHLKWVIFIRNKQLVEVPFVGRFVLQSKSIAIFKYLISQIWDLIRIWGFRSGLNMKPLNTSILFICINIYIFSISFDLNLAQEVNISQLENYVHLKMLSINRKEGFLNPTKWNFGVLLWACSVLTFWMGSGIPQFCLNKYIT